jgi:hypothetical protein
MTTQEFERALLEADAFNIAEAGLRQGLTQEEYPIVIANCIKHPKMITSLRSVRMDDEWIALAMVDPVKFADDIYEDAFPNPDVKIIRAK